MPKGRFFSGHTWTFNPRTALYVTTRDDSSHSEDDFQCELYLALADRGKHVAEGERTQRSVDPVWAEPCVVEQVKKLSTELKLHFLANRRVLDECGIEVVYPWPVE